MRVKHKSIFKNFFICTLAMHLEQQIVEPSLYKMQERKRACTSTIDGAEIENNNDYRYCTTTSS